MPRCGRCALQQRDGIVASATRGICHLAEKHFRHRNRAVDEPEPESIRRGSVLQSWVVLALHGTRWGEAYDAFYQATWNQAWAGASYHALAELDCRKKKWGEALSHVERSLRLDVENTRARNLKVMILRRLEGGSDTAETVLKETLALDPLDWQGRDLRGDDIGCDAQTRLDVAFDYAGAGFYEEAIQVLMFKSAELGDTDYPLPTQDLGTGPMVAYTLGWLCEQKGETKEALAHFRNAGLLAAGLLFSLALGGDSGFGIGNAGRCQGRAGAILSGLPSV